MLMPIAARVFNGDSKPEELEAKVTSVGIVARLYVPAIVGADFIILGAWIKREHYDGQIVLIPEGETLATLLSEMSMGLADLDVPVGPGDVIVTKVARLTDFCVPDRTSLRMFRGSWDVVTARPSV